MRTRRPWIRVTVVGRAGYVSGVRSKELIETCGGRPQWISRRKAWATTSERIADVLAMAEAEGYAVDYRAGGEVR